MKYTEKYSISKPSLSRISTGFTLIELIVVITILAILGTIGFVQLWGFAGSARDSVRISNLTNLKKGLDLSQIQTGVYPLPESSVNITASWVVIGYQGFAKEQVEWVAKLSPWATKDPSDTTMYTTYSTNANQTKMQAMVFLEDGGSVTSLVPSFVTEAHASTSSDYSKRFPTTTGDSLGIVLSNSGADAGKPAQEISSIIASGALDIQKTSDTFKAYFSTSDTLEGTGTALQSLQISYLHGAGLNSPSKCPTGFISVPGNKEFNQPGFCVAKYEMKPVSTVGLTQHATYKTWNYAPWMTITSVPTGEPIATINQPDAIQLCKNLGTGYHLITNNEWMTIARNIEQQPTNWSTNTVGTGYIYSGHNDNSPAIAISASSNDSDGYNQTGNSSGNQKRTLTLSNGQVVWDLAGNVWEHVNKANTLDGSDYNVWQTALWTWGAWWYEWNNAEIDTTERSLYGPSASSYISTHGMGQIYQTAGVPTNIFIRGGNWGNDAGVGVFTLSLAGASGSADSYVGFRCAR